jgi:hypothetical protein
VLLIEKSFHVPVLMLLQKSDPLIECLFDFRNMRGDDAKKVCPDIELVQVPMAHGHAYLAPYRDAGSEVVAILSRMGTCERASVDEVYLDITEAAAARLLEDPPLSQSLSEEAQRTHVLGLVEGSGYAKGMPQEMINCLLAVPLLLLSCVLQFYKRPSSHALQGLLTTRYC